MQDFEAQITAQLSNMQSDFDKKLSHLNRGSSGMKGLDTTTAVAGIETVVEDLDALKSPRSASSPRMWYSLVVRIVAQSLARLMFEGLIEFQSFSTPIAAT